MPDESYFLPSGYRVNNPIHYSMQDYWTPSQIQNAKYYQAGVYKFAARWIRHRDLGSLCDVGCGPGVKLQMIHQKFPDLAIWGMDQPEPIEWCRKTYDFGKWTAMDLNQPNDVPESVCDMAICSDVIEHLDQPDNLLRLLSRLIKPAGYVLLSTPDRDRLRDGDRGGPPANPAHVREWNRRELAQYVESHGFRILKHFYTSPVPFAFNRLWWDEVVWRWRHGKTARYNQVVLMTR